MTRDKLIETMARAMCAGRACERDCPDVEHKPCPDSSYAWREDVERILTALESSGMVVVPREPTEEMIAAMPHFSDTGREVWLNAIAASPTQRDASSDRGER